MDHDQRFKTLIREFFADFLHLFFADWAARMDLSALQWLDKELFPDPPEGKRHGMDLVARVPFAFPDAGAAAEAGEAEQAAASILLVHIEIESPDHTTALKPRFPYYYHFLRDKYELPVLPIALYLKVGLDGIGVDTAVESTWKLEVNRFQFLYVGLPGLDGLQYLQGGSWLGVALAALMNIPRDRVAWLGAEALRRISGSQLPDQRKFLLGECVQAYLPLDEQQQREYQRLLQTETYQGVHAMNKTVYEEGVEKGRRAGQLELTAALIEEYFGPVTPEVRARLEQLPLDELKALALRVGKAASLAELGLPEAGSRQ